MEPLYTVYTKSNCGYCVRAKALLTERGLTFKEIFVADDDDQARKVLFARTAMKTFPQIFHGDTLVGGYTELSEYLK